jgi:hypothetical protein
VVGPLLGLVTIKQAFQHCKLTSSDVRLMLPNPYIGSPTSPSLIQEKKKKKKKTPKKQEKSVDFFFFAQ